jgi:hypothetical protein
MADLIRESIALSAKPLSGYLDVPATVSYHIDTTEQRGNADLA